ncbi:MAG: GNAT family N-acetyltransferase, partial [Chloroflexota bacterium]
MPAQKNKIRPMDPFRDMRALADLLELAFGEVLDSSGRQMIREARSWASARYLYQPLQLLTGSMSPLGPGFVWVKDDKIVGHTTLIRSNRRPGVWQIANVAVHPQYQRQGIASELMKHVLELVRRKDGRLVALQVRRESAAVGLYDKLGFEA